MLVKSGKIYLTIQRYKNSFYFVMKFVFAFVLVYYLVEHIEFEKIQTGLSSVNFHIIGIVILLSFLNIYLQFRKWELITNTILNVTEKRKIFLSLFYGFSSGIITPMRFGEFIGRKLPFKEKTVTEITIATIIDKFYPLFVTAFIGSIASVMYIFYYYDVSFYISSALLLVLFGLFYFFFSIINNTDFWKKFLLRNLMRVRFIKSRLSKVSVISKLDNKTTVKVSLYSLFFYLTYIVQFSLLISAFTLEMDFIHYFWAGTLVMFSKTIIPPISLGDLGIREGASVFFLSAMGVAEAAAFNSAIFLFIINLAIPSLIGLVLLFKRIDD